MAIQKINNYIDTKDLSNLCYNIDVNRKGDFKGFIISDIYKSGGFFEVNGDYANNNSDSTALIPNPNFRLNYIKSNGSGLAVSTSGGVLSELNQGVYDSFKYRVFELIYFVSNIYKYLYTNTSYNNNLTPNLLSGNNLFEDHTQQVVDINHAITVDQTAPTTYVYDYALNYDGIVQFDYGQILFSLNLDASSSIDIDILLQNQGIFGGTVSKSMASQTITVGNESVYFFGINSTGTPTNSDNRFTVNQWKIKNIKVILTVTAGKINGGTSDFDFQMSYKKIRELA